MSRTLRIGIVFICGLVLILLVGWLVVVRAVKHVPKFYREALEVDPEAQEKASDRMVRQTMDLANNVQSVGAWRAVFTAEDVNGWLAWDLPRNFRDDLPPSMHEPRIVIEEDGITMGCRVDQGSLSGVATLTVSVSLEKANTIALRIRKARIGTFPLPLKKVTDHISQTAAHSNAFVVHWGQVDNEPVALVTITGLDRGHGRVSQIETLELRNGEIVVAGTTKWQK
jgi:hypothetical protein